jgi:SRSO17 transposase
MNDQQPRRAGWPARLCHRAAGRSGRGAGGRDRRCEEGTCTAGVARHYTGTAGWTGNAQVAVYLTYAAPAGHALIDRELYLPASWISDPGRCRAAGIAPGTVFATKPGLARQMIVCALDGGTPASWVAGDEVYGADPGLRAGLGTRQVGYVLAIARHRHVATAAGAPRADALAAGTPQPAHRGTGLLSLPVAPGQRARYR